MPLTVSHRLIVRLRDQDLCVVTRKRDSIEYASYLKGNMRAPLFDRMTTSELERLRTKDFKALWLDLWKDHVRILPYAPHLPRTFERTRRAIPADVRGYPEPEWDFPGGRPWSETPRACALREFCEEIGWPNSTTGIHFDDSRTPIVVHHEGSDGRTYESMYHWALADRPFELVPNPAEVSAAQWVPFAEAIERLRPYHHLRSIFGSSASSASFGGTMPFRHRTTSFAPGKTPEVQD